MKREHRADHPRYAALRGQAVLFGVLFLLAAALVAVLWVFTDVVVASVFTCLAVLFALAEGIVFFRGVLCAMRLAAVRVAEQLGQAVVPEDGCALFFDADTERFLTYADALLRAESAPKADKKRMRAEVKRARNRLGKPLRIQGFTAKDAASLHGKTLYLSGAYYDENGGLPPVKKSRRAEERYAAWQQAAQKNLIVVQGRDKT